LSIRTRSKSKPALLQVGGAGIELVEVIEE
jgi:hypothetical protein